MPNQRVYYALAPLAFGLSLVAMGQLQAPAPFLEIEESKWGSWYSNDPAGIFRNALLNGLTWSCLTGFFVAVGRFLREQYPAQRGIGLLVALALLAPLCGLVTDAVIMLTASAAPLPNTPPGAGFLDYLRLEHRMGGIAGSAPLSLAQGAFLAGAGWLLRPLQSWGRWLGWAGLVGGGFRAAMVVAGVFMPPVGAYQVSPLTPGVLIAYVLWTTALGVALTIRPRLPSSPAGRARLA